MRTKGIWGSGDSGERCVRFVQGIPYLWLPECDNTNKMLDLRQESLQLHDSGLLRADALPEGDQQHGMCVGGNEEGSTTNNQMLQLETCLDSSDPASDHTWAVQLRCQCYPFGGLWSEFHLYNTVMDKCMSSGTVLDTYGRKVFGKTCDYESNTRKY